MTKHVDETLAERGEHYGDFKETFAVIQRIKAALQTGSGWHAMSMERREALEMIAVKMGRLVSGDSGHADSWHDVAGYARLVEQDLVGGSHARTATAAPTELDELAAFERWFKSQQGIQYDGMWSFAKSAWLCRAGFVPATVNG